MNAPVVSIATRDIQPPPIPPIIREHSSWSDLGFYAITKVKMSLATQGLVDLLDSRIGIVYLQDRDEPVLFPLSSNQLFQRIPRIPAGILERVGLGPSELDILLAGLYEEVDPKGRIFRDVLFDLEKVASSDEDIQRIFRLLKRKIHQTIIDIDDTYQSNDQKSLKEIFSDLEKASKTLPPLE